MIEKKARELGIEELWGTGFIDAGGLQMNVWFIPKKVNILVVIIENTEFKI